MHMIHTFSIIWSKPEQPRIYDKPEALCTYYILVHGIDSLMYMMLHYGW